MNKRKYQSFDNPCREDLIYNRKKLLKINPAKDRPERYNH